MSSAALGLAGRWRTQAPVTEAEVFDRLQFPQAEPTIMSGSLYVQGRVLIVSSACKTKPNRIEIDCMDMRGNAIILTVRENHPETCASALSLAW